MTTIHSRKLFLMLAALLRLTAAYALEYEQFVYEPLDNGEARVTGLTEAGKAAEMLSIPEMHNGNPVTRIAGYALSGAKCYGITIPNSVRHISGYAFYNCQNLIYLEIPPSVTNAIPTALVYDCPKLGEVAFCLTNETSAVKIGNKCLSEVPALTNVVVRGNGAMTLGDSAFYELASIQAVTLQGVVEIENGSSWNTGAFNGCTNLEQVMLIDSPLRNIGTRAFRNCAALASLAIPNTVTNIGSYAFSGCAALKSATFPEGLQSMGLQIFYNCTSLGEATLPDSLCETKNDYSYSDGYFTGCTSMTNLVIGSGIPVVKMFHLPFDSTNAFTVTVNGSGATVIERNAFMNTKAGSVVLNGVASIEGTSSSGESAFRDCTSLTEVVFGYGLAEVGDQAFRGCSALKSVTIPNTVTNLGSSAFSGCTSLRTATLNEGLRTIGSSAFNGCTSLTEMTLPDSLVTTGKASEHYGIFVGCTSMTNLVIGSGVAEVTRFFAPINSTNAFTVTVNGSGETVIDCNAFKDTKAGSVVLNGVASIEGTSSSGEGAFRDCTSLTEVIFGDGLSEIGGQAFRGCSALKSVVLPNTVTNLGSSAFNGCTSLRELVLPESVETIGNYSFSGTTLLTNIVFQGETAPAIGDWAFEGTTAGLVLTVPFDGMGYGVENGATGNWTKIAPEKVQYTGGAESGYGAWAVSVDLAGKGTAAMMGGYGLDDKVANAFIYAFDDAATNTPLMTISFDANGKPVVTTPPLVRTEGVTLKLLSSVDLGDWTSAGESEIKSGSGGNIIAFPSETSSRKFYKLVAE